MKTLCLVDSKKNRYFLGCAEFEIRILKNIKIIIENRTLAVSLFRKKMEENAFSASELRELLANISSSLSSQNVVPIETIESLLKMADQLSESLNISSTTDTNGKSNEILLIVALLNAVKSQNVYFWDQLTKVGKAFGVTSNMFSDADSLVKEIAEKLSLNPTEKEQDLSEQIILKYPATAEISQLSGFSNFLNESSSFVDDNGDKDKQIAYLKKKVKQLKNGFIELQNAAKKKIKRNAKKLNEKLDEIKNQLEIEKGNSKALHHENESLKKRIENLKNDNEEYDQKIQILTNAQDIDTGNAEALAKMVKNINDLALQNQELLDENLSAVKLQGKLVELNKKLQSAVIYYEKEFDNLKALSRKEQTQPEIILTPIKEDDTELFDSISETISNISSAVIHDIVDAIQDIDYTKEDKVKEIVSLLVKEIQRLQKEVSLNESASNSATIQRLLSVIHSELNFIERLSNSDQERNWLIVSKTDDARKALAQQANRLQLFLSEYTDGFINDEDIFDSLTFSENPLTIADKLQAFLNNFPSVRTNEGKELFALLRQSYAAANILRRFAIESRSQCLIQASELRSLRNELTVARNDLESQLEEEIAAFQQQIDAEVQEREKLDETLHTVLNILKSSMIEQSPSIPDILDCIERCKSVIEPQQVDEEAYEQSLEKKLALALSKLQESNEYQLNADRELSEIKETQQDLKLEAQSLLQTRTEELEETKAKLERFKLKVAALNEDLEDSQDIINQLKEQIKEERGKAASTVSQMKSELEVIKKKMDKRLTKAAMTIAENERQRRTQLKQRMINVRNENQQLIEQLNDKTREIQIMQEKIDMLNNESLNKSKKKKDGQKSKSQTMEELKNEIRDLSSKLSEVQVEKRVLYEKVQSYEKRKKKEKNMLDNMLASKQSMLETEFQARQQKLKSDMIESHRNFLTNVFQVFKGIMNVPNPVTDQDAFNMIKAAAKMINPDIKTANVVIIRPFQDDSQSSEQSGNSSDLQQSSEIIQT